jgi:hypothetical protein
MAGQDDGAALLRLVNGAATAQAVAVAARLGLADLLAEGPSDAAALAAATGTHAPSMHRLLRMLAALGIAVEAPDDRFALGPLGRRLRAGVPGSMRDLVLLFGHPDFWATWARSSIACAPARPRCATFSAPLPPSNVTRLTRPLGRSSMPVWRCWRSAARRRCSTLGPFRTAGW